MSNLTNIEDNQLKGNSDYTGRLTLLRKKLGLTQTQFAEKINISVPLLSDMETKKKKLSLRTAIEIRKAFNVSLDWLYELSDDTNDTASNIIDNLKDVFKIDFKNKTIDIDEDLGEFLEKIFDAYKIKSEKSIPDDALKYWVDGIKKEYNEKQKSNTSKVVKKYYLQDYLEHKVDAHATGHLH